MKSLRSLRHRAIALAMSSTVLLWRMRSLSASCRLLPRIRIGTCEQLHSQPLDRYTTNKGLALLCLSHPSQVFDTVVDNIDVQLSNSMLACS
jgi:hypothetical protein